MGNKASKLKAHDKLKNISINSQRGSSPLASEHKSRDIEADGFDPTLISNLSSLGQVKVPELPNTHNRSKNDFTHILEERRKSQLLEDEEAKGPSVGATRVKTSTLSTLLQQRTRVKSREEFVALCRQHNVDPGVLDAIAVSFNAPTPSEKADGTEVEIRQALWTDPKY